RNLFLQALLLFVLIFVVWQVIDTTASNLARQGTATGFDFLDQTTGFSVNQSLVEYSEQSSYKRLLFVGLLNTVLVASLGIVLATALGFVIGIMRLSTNWLIAKLAAIYIETFRNLPLLIQILFWYTLITHFLPQPKQSLAWLDSVFLNKRGLYFPAIELGAGGQVMLFFFAVAVIGFFALSHYLRKRQERTGKPLKIRRYYLLSVFILGLGLWLYFKTPFILDIPYLRGFNFRGGISLIPEFVALTFALTIYTASFIAEIVRSGISAVPHGQNEAARALGLSPLESLQKVIIPQALRVIIPPLTSQYLNLTKNSSLAAAIAYPELVSVFAGTALNQTGQAVEIIFITMSIYLSLSLLTSLLMNWYNARIALTER
ncbi:MAG: ABC transporter permease subunit, partial [Alphaproteobacteria bacterium]|nr:ABC transporter permease subunit [Alphaproteobacteria bacterium]